MIYHRRTAITLIEVVAALVLMAGVMSTALVAFADHQRAAQLAVDRSSAVRIADDLLLSLSSRRTGFPVNASGVIAPSVTNRSRWRWQTNVIGVGTVLTIQTQTVRFEIRRADGQQILSVDLLLPLEQTVADF